MNEIREALPGGWISILVVIILGALGSATWDILLKPTLSKGRNFILSFVTLWRDNLKDNIYRQVSFGPAKQHLSLFNARLLLLIFLIITVIFFFFAKKISLDSANNLYEEIIKIESSSVENEPMDIITVKNNIESLKETAFYSVLILGLFSLYLVADTVANYIKVVYIHSVSCHLDSMLKIISPHLSSEEISIYQSKIASISNRSDYHDIVGQLYDKAESEKLNYRRFDAW